MGVTGMGLEPEVGLADYYPLAFRRLVGTLQVMGVPELPEPPHRDGISAADRLSLRDEADLASDGIHPPKLVELQIRAG